MILPALLAFAGFTLALHILTAALAGARYLRPDRTTKNTAPLPFFTLLRPVCGLDAHDAETLSSSFHLEGADYEVIFCAARESDAAVPLVRALIKAHPQVKARLLIGETIISKNPKLNNLQKGIEAAASDWIVMADSNLLLPADYLQRLWAEWTPETGLVSAPPAGIRPANFWGAVECAFLNGNQARWQLAADAVGAGFAQGKTMFWHRKILMQGGGLAALGRNMAEDVAATKLVREQGLNVRLPRHLFAQPIGARGARPVWDRQLRWSKVRRDGFLPLFAAEIAQGPVLAILAVGVLVLTGTLPVMMLPLFLAAWYGTEWALCRVAGWPAEARDIAAAMLRDLMLPALWFATWVTRDFVWRGTDMRPVTAQG